MSDMENRVDRELGWDDEISNDGSEFTLLPEGDYDFEVVKFERGRYTPGKDAKLPPCNMAILTIDVGGDQAAARITHRLMLHTKVEWKLAEFFTAIGQRKHGEVLKPRWNEVVGSTGRCQLGIREWTNTKTGAPMQSNEIKKFYEPTDAPAPATAPAAPKTYQEGMF